MTYSLVIQWVVVFGLIFGNQNFDRDFKVLQLTSFCIPDVRDVSYRVIIFQLKNSVSVKSRMPDLIIIHANYYKDLHLDL